jgi:hypothetical protein
MVSLSALHIEQSADRRAVRGALWVADSRECFEFLSQPGDRAASSIASGRAAAEGRRLVVWSSSTLRTWNQLLSALGLPEWVEDPVRLRDLSIRALPGLGKNPGVEDLAVHAHLPVPDVESPASVSRFFATACASLFALLPGEFAADSRVLSEWIREARPRVDFSRFGFGPEFLDTIPEAPGVYLMRNRAGHVVYVGKSSNLRRRVRSYFTPAALRDTKVARIHQHLYRIEFSATASEVEALVMEMHLIRDLQPPVNLQSEVNDRSDRRGRPQDAILVIPTGARATLYLLHQGAFVAEMSAGLGKPAGKAVRARVKRVYFGARTPKPAGESWETELVTRWFAAHKREVNYVDVGEAGGLEETLRLLDAYLRDPDRLEQKVIYRP